MSDKLIGLASKKLGLVIAAGWAIMELAKTDSANTVQYGWMITILGCSYMLAEVVCKYVPYSDSVENVK